MVAVNMILGPVTGLRTANSNTTVSLSDADNSHAGIIVIPRDGIINKVGFYVNTVTGNPPAYYVGIVTLDANNCPTAVAYGGSVIETYDFTITGWIWVTLATPATVAAGDMVAVRVWPTASAPDAANCILIRRCQTMGPWYWPHSATWTTAWIYYGDYISGGAMYNDGTVAMAAIIEGPNVSINTATAPDEIGALFQVPFECEAIGARFWASMVVSADYTAKLYDAADNLLASRNVDGTNLDNTLSIHNVYFDGVTLSPGVNYRITILPTSANSVAPYYWLVNEVASRGFWPEGARWQWTERTDAGAWTDRPTYVPLCGLILDAITVGGQRAYAA